MALKNHRAVVVGTPGIANRNAIGSDRLVGAHAYSVLGTEVSHGKRYILLRNPWGKTEPGSDGQDDGNFRMTLEDSEPGRTAATAGR